MKYSITELAREYSKDLTSKDFDLKLQISQPFPLDTYNDYKYLRVLDGLNNVYDKVDSLSLTERFLKGD